MKDSNHRLLWIIGIFITTIISFIFSSALIFNHLAKRKLIYNGIGEEGKMVFRTIHFSTSRLVTFLYEDPSMPGSTMEVSVLPWLDCLRFDKIKDFPE